MRAHALRKRQRVLFLCATLSNLCLRSDALACGHMLLTFPGLCARMARHLI